ncbi:class II aldolase/adducin family protein [Arcobacteraceae bacterium]|nr:class II aldolase/adducin family protein [Arcobacteraceae bacterium]
MTSLYDDNVAASFTSDLEFRVYTSRLLGGDSSLVLHGGGNTSVKSVVDGEEILYVKGSGWDLATIEAEGFAPVKLDVLKEMAALDKLSDTEMVSQQKAAMIDKSAPNPSVEAILHAIIPFKYVDHTHSDSVVTISNSENGIENIKEVYPNYLVIPYVMPGFILAQTIYRELKHIDWDKCEGIILHNHGIFTFDNDPKISYEKMIKGVTQAEEFLDKKANFIIEKYMPRAELNIENLKEIVSQEKGYEVFLKINQSPLALHYASQRNLNDFAKRGVLTPEHIIRTKRDPMILEDENIQKSIDTFEEEYLEYYNQFTSNEIMINPTPNWVVIKNYGTVSFGKNEKEASIIEDINNHTMLAVLRADMLGGYKSISLSDCFDMEYWELEQAKLKK